MDKLSIATLKADILTKIKYNPDITHDNTKTSGADDRQNREDIIDTFLGEITRRKLGLYIGTWANNIEVPVDAVTLHNGILYRYAGNSPIVSQTAPDAPDNTAFEAVSQNVIDPDTGLIYPELLPVRRFNPLHFLYEDVPPAEVTDDGQTKQVSIHPDLLAAIQGLPGQAWQVYHTGVWANGSYVMHVAEGVLYLAKAIADIDNSQVPPTANNAFWNILFDSSDLGSSGDAFTPIPENQYGTHPAFSNQHTLNAYLLANMGSESSEPDTLATPANFTATAVSSSQINLSWSAVPNATSYTLQRATDSGFATNLQTIYSGSAITVQNTSGLIASTLYYYRVLATATGYPSSSYATTSEETLAIPQAAPVTNFTAVAQSDTEILLTWTNPS